MKAIKVWWIMVVANEQTTSKMSSWFRTVWEVKGQALIKRRMIKVIQVVELGVFRGTIITPRFIIRGQGRTTHSHTSKAKDIKGHLKCSIIRCLNSLTSKATLLFPSLPMMKAFCFRPLSRAAIRINARKTSENSCKMGSISFKIIHFNIMQSNSLNST